MTAALPLVETVQVSGPVGGGVLFPPEHKTLNIRCHLLIQQTQLRCQKQKISLHGQRLLELAWVPVVLLSASTDWLVCRWRSSEILAELVGRQSCRHYLGVHL